MGNWHDELLDQAYQKQRAVLFLCVAMPNGQICHAKADLAVGSLLALTPTDLAERYMVPGWAAIRRTITERLRAN